MTVKSNVNPNYPLPGIDQSTKGFRDNFSIIKAEIENLQSKTIQVTGSLLSPPVQIGSGNGTIAIPVTVNIANTPAAGSNLSVQYNNNGSLAGSQIFIQGPLVGINNPSPTVALDINGNLNVISPNFSSRIQIGSNLRIRSTIYSSNISIDNVVVMSMFNTTKNVGIGIANISPPPSARLEVLSPDSTISIFRSNSTSTNNSVRFDTDQPNTDIGLVLRQVPANVTGGIKLSSTGNISIHADNTGNTELLNSTGVIFISNTKQTTFEGNVGIFTTPNTYLDVNGDQIRLRTSKTPSSATATGNIGDICWDADYIYVCIAADTWKRSSLSSW